MKKKLLKTKDIDTKLKDLSGWQINKAGTQLSKTFTCPNFVAGLSFCAKIAVHAEVMGHHPDIELSYTKVKIKLTTHALKGLSKDDFILAKKIDELTT